MTTKNPNEKELFSSLLQKQVESKWKTLEAHSGYVTTHIMSLMIGLTTTTVSILISSNVQAAMWLIFIGCISLYIALKSTRGELYNTFWQMIRCKIAILKLKRSCEVNDAELLEIFKLIGS